MTSVSAQIVALKNALLKKTLNFSDILLTSWYLLLNGTFEKCHSDLVIDLTVTNVMWDMHHERLEQGFPDNQQKVNLDK